MPDIYKAKPSEAKPAADLDEPMEQPIHSAGMFSAYARHPDNIHFENQEPGEQIELFLRRHPVTNFGWLTIAAGMLVAPLILRVFPIIDFLPARFQLVAILIWYLLNAAVILEGLLDWLFNVYIVTNKRVIDVDFRSLIYKEVSDANLDRIQDVTFSVGGVAGTLFNFGNVVIQTAGTAPNFDFVAVPKPDEVARRLQELRTGEKSAI